MSKIKSVIAREIIDSRGNPTVEVDIRFSDNHFGRAAVPSGASTGSHEAVELRDGGKRFDGKGVQHAVKNVNTIIAKALKNKEFDQRSLDKTLIDLDGTPNKSKLGANAILGVSLAFARGMAHEKNIALYTYFNKLMPKKTPICLPVPMINIVNGGRHAENSADIQEYMVIPAGFKSFSEAIRAGAEVFSALKKILKSRKLSTLVGDEGGFAPSLPSNEAPIQVIMEAITTAGYKPGKEVFIGLDVAATELYKDGKYNLARDGKTCTSAEMISMYEGFVKNYPVLSIEDGLSEDDWDGWVSITKSLGSKIELVGDDLFVTNIERLGTGIEKHAGNSILIKLNQIGTVSETIDAITLAKKAGYRAIISHRSGETEDTTIADFAVGTGVGFIKAGSLSRTDRIAKYNQLLRIEEELGAKAIYGNNNK